MVTLGKRPAGRLLGILAEKLRGGTSLRSWKVGEFRGQYWTVYILDISGLGGRKITAGS